MTKSIRAKLLQVTCAGVCAALLVPSLSYAQSNRYVAEFCPSPYEVKTKRLNRSCARRHSGIQYRFCNFKFAKGDKANADYRLHFVEAIVRFSDAAGGETPKKVDVTCYYATKLKDKNNNPIEIRIEHVGKTSRKEVTFSLSTVAYPPWSLWQTRDRKNYTYRCTDSHDRCGF